MAAPAVTYHDISSVLCQGGQFNCVVTEFLLQGYSS